MKHVGILKEQQSNLIMSVICWENLRFSERVILKSLNIAARAFKLLQTSDLTLMALKPCLEASVSEANARECHEWRYVRYPFKVIKIAFNLYILWSLIQYLFT